MLVGKPKVDESIGEPLLKAVRAKGQVTLPASVRESAHIKEGDLVEIRVVPEGILLSPKKVIPADQAWFWTESWQAGERAATADIAAGRIVRYSSDEDFLASLEE